MRIVGITLMWVGAIALLKNMGFIEVVDWNIIWPVAVIIAGISLKHSKHSMMCAMGGKCDVCGRGGKCCKGGVCEHGEGHQCEGGKCDH